MNITNYTIQNLNQLQTFNITEVIEKNCEYDLLYHSGFFIKKESIAIIILSSIILYFYFYHFMTAIINTSKKFHLQNFILYIVLNTLYFIMCLSISYIYLAFYDDLFIFRCYQIAIGFLVMVIYGYIGKYYFMHKNIKYYS